MFVIVAVAVCVAVVSGLGGVWAGLSQLSASSSSESGPGAGPPPPTQPPPPSRGRKYQASCCCCSRTSSASAALLGATVTLLSQLQQYHTTQPSYSHRTTSNWKSLSIGIGQIGRFETGNMFFMLIKATLRRSDDLSNYSVSIYKNY